MTNSEKMNSAMSAVLRPGETVKHCCYGINPPRLLPVLAILFGSFLPAAAVWWILSPFQLNVPFSTIIAILVWIGMTSIISAPVKKPRIVALTDRRLVVAAVKNTQITFSPVVTSVLAECAQCNWPKIDVSEKGMRKFFTMFGTDVPDKILLAGWPENLEAARAIAGEVSSRNPSATI
jgi:hypothetical protein